MLRTILDKVKELFKFIESFQKESHPLRIFNLAGSSRAIHIILSPFRTIYIEKNENLQNMVYQDMMFFSKLFGLNDCIIMLMSGNEPHDEGMRSLFILKSEELRHIVVNSSIFDVDFYRMDELQSRIINIKKGNIYERLALTEFLVKLGYKKSPVVTRRGEFSLRNFILDVFPSTSDSPLRIEFFGDEVENIRRFDIETQRANDEVSEIDILPARPPHRPSGEGIQKIDEIITDRRIYINGDFSFEISVDLKDAISLSSYSLKAEGIDGGFASLAGTGLPFNERDSIEEFPLRLKPYLKEKKVIITLKTPSQAMRVRDILSKYGIIAPILSIEEIMDYKGNIVLTPQSPSSGFMVNNTILITYRELFGEVVWARKTEKSKISRLLKTIDDLEEGDYVVHKKHGIGIYRGITRINIEDVIEDLLVVEYRGGDRVYIPPRNIHELSKFRATEGVKPEIDVLGGRTWERTKRRVKKGIEEMAHRLLRLYAEREIYKGKALSKDTELHREFDGFFEYEETPDQLKAIEEIKHDLESDRPMDRLLVGDVGYGKTEVAMRAAFKAVYDGKQVAVLVPTTILAEQHLRTFRERFLSFPVRIEALSSMRSMSEKKKIIESLKKGEIDIIIGTHALLGKDVVLHDPGLLIIDEEHRFGVKDKERLRELKKGLHTLSMSATPIPRTLQMALTGLRNMSVIETPPEERLAVKTEVYVFNENIIETAIRHELQRGGQVFFVHNKIKDIMEIRDLVKRIVPEAKTGVAHGEMKRRELDHVMMKFLFKEIDVLISTSIIGSGLDIPSANTIIIDNAHEFGLSDLYQLRGRVGRSNIRAYAYLLIPGWNIISDDARKRLQSISEMSYLGSGLRIAITDLEIRGAGNLLGKEQSGHINAVGLDLYLEMLEKTIAELRGIKTEERPDVHLNIHISAMIPDDYIEDINTRLGIYRRLGVATTDEEIEDIRRELIERFGPIPQPVENLLRLSFLRLICEELSIEAIIQKNNIFEIRYKKILERNDLERILESIRSHREMVINSVEKRMISIRINERDSLGRLFLFLSELRSKN